MKLTPRLQALAYTIPQDSVVADIGTDHALLPIELVESGRVKRVYACDLRPGPLDKAKQNIQTHGLEDAIIPVLSNGLEKVPQDADTVVLAGMGGLTALSILEADLTRCAKLKRIILQVNKGMVEVRRWLSDHHYTILEEHMVEDDFFYQIEVVSPAPHAWYTDDEILFGPIFLREKSENFLRYYHQQADKLTQIIGQMEDGMKKDILQKQKSRIETLWGK